MSTRRRRRKSSESVHVGMVGRGRREHFLSLLDAGYSIEDAMKEVGIGVREIAEWLEDEEFIEEIERWRRGMAIVVEGKLVETAKKGRTVAAIGFLRSIEPERWSDRLKVSGGINEERVVKVVFGWVPNDSVAMQGGSRLALGAGEVVDTEFSVSEGSLEEVRDNE